MDGWRMYGWVCDSSHQRELVPSFGSPVSANGSRSFQPKEVQEHLGASPSPCSVLHAPGDHGN